MTSIIALIIQFIFILSIAPFAMGLVRFLKARFQGRHGASPFLPYVTLAVMLKKETVIPAASSWIFKIAPIAVFASAVGLAIVVPTLFLNATFADMGDFFVVAGLLMIGSIFLVLGGMDTGSAFGGMGSSREMTMATILEPALLLVFAAFALISGSFNINGMLVHPLLPSNPFLILSLIALVLVALGENARYPVDNPATHLELTMIHEAMILEYSGPFLAIMEYASAIKLTIFSFLICNFIFPTLIMIPSVGFFGLLLGIILALLKIVIVMTLLALLESTIVKMRFYRMNEFSALAFFSALFGIITAVFIKTVDLNVEYHSFFAALVILFTILLFTSVRMKSILRFYLLSSLSIAGVAISLGILEKEERFHLFIFAAGTILIKVIIVPLLIKYAMKYFIDKKLETFFSATNSYFFAGLILIVTLFAVNNIPLLGAVKWVSILYASIALIIFGVMKMVINRNIFSQIAGFLVLENGLALFTLVTIKTLPFLIETGIFASILVAVFILSKLSINIKELHGTSDTEKLRNLID